MNVEETIAREQIRHLIGKYAVSGDQLDIDSFVGTFTEEDGVLEMATFKHEGRAAIKHWMMNAEPFGEENRRPTFVRHHITSSLIAFDKPELATGRTYFLVMTDVGVDHTGYYADKIRKVGDEWLFAHRRIRVLWRAPNAFVPASTMFSARP